MAQRALVILMLGAVATMGLTGPANAGTVEEANGKSVFVDLGARPAWETAARIQRVCRELRDPSGETYIHNVVLVGVVHPGSGELRVEQLNGILPHVPGGGAEQCFDNVFIGPAVLPDSEDPWKGRPDYPQGLEPWCADSPYCGGMLTGSWRWDNLQANRAAADRFLEFVAQSFPDVLPNLQWYVTYEGYVDWFGDNKYSGELTSAYEAYFLQLAREYSSALAGVGDPDGAAERTILWSPSYEDTFEAHSTHELEAIRTNLRSLLANIRERADTEGLGRGLEWIHMQDRLGQIGCFTEACYSSVASWYRFLSSVNNEEVTLTNLRVNMELFVPGASPQGDPAEHRTRTAFYRKAGVPIGASWELQFLLPEIPEPPEEDQAGKRKSGFVKERPAWVRLPVWE